MRQFLQINDNTKLSDITRIVGNKYIDQTLALNNLPRKNNIGQVYKAAMQGIIATTPVPDWQRKSTLLNGLVDSSDVFEKAALGSPADWAILSATSAFKNFIKVPETVQLPFSNNILGDGIHIANLVYRNAMDQLQREPHTIDPAIFNEYSTIRPTTIVDGTQSTSADPFQMFHIPWGEVTLYCDIDNSKIEFPVYPAEYDNSISANYTQMPDLLYQYEPWYVYQNSGPRTLPLSFNFHRDMWSGDHRDGKAEELIRYCEACCYPEYRGSAVNVPIVTFYIAGRPLITGILTKCSHSWKGPIGLDGLWLECTLSIEITEISPYAKNFHSVKNTKLYKL